jgi:hypothetical protein
MRVEAASLDALSYIIAHMRESDRIELAATSCTGDTDYLPRAIMGFAVAAFVARDEAGTPVSAWGLTPLWPGVGLAWAFGTDQWPRALLTMTRHVKRFMIPLVLDNGYHRIECRAMSGRADVGRWVAQFGAKAEAVMRSSGRRGEDFTLYRWLSDEHRRRATADKAGNPASAGNSSGHPRTGRAVSNLL